MYSAANVVSVRGLMLPAAPDNGATPAGMSLWVVESYQWWIGQKNDLPWREALQGIQRWTPLEKNEVQSAQQDAMYSSVDVDREYLFVFPPPEK